ncbi:MAG: 3'(2'),5'-bisphosphate nucleotidase CysQ [Pseudomonadota bacterium]
MTNSAHHDMIATFQRLALAAGAVIMEAYNRPDFDVRQKSDASPVTEADEAADRLIAAGLSARFPHVPLVTEEQADTHSIDAKTFFIVDPLDGTKEFVHRRGDFTVNIALVEDGAPTLGVVYAPAKGRLFVAGPDAATELTVTERHEVVGEPSRLRVATPDNAALRIVASKSHRTPELEDYIAQYKIAESVAAGSSLKFCLLASGEADLYPRLGPTMEWDTAAGHAVLKRAGGRVVTFDSSDPLAYGKPGFRNPHFIALVQGVLLSDR